MQGRLSIAGNMSNYSLENLRFVRSGTQIGVEILQLDLLAAEVVAKSTKLATLVLVTLLILKLVIFYPLAHQRRILFQYAAHRECGKLYPLCPEVWFGKKSKSGNVWFDHDLSGHVFVASVETRCAINLRDWVYCAVRGVSRGGISKKMLLSKWKKRRDVDET